MLILPLDTCRKTRCSTRTERDEEPCRVLLPAQTLVYCRAEESKRAGPNGTVVCGRGLTEVPLGIPRRRRLTFWTLGHTLTPCAGCPPASCLDRSPAASAGFLCRLDRNRSCYTAVCAVKQLFSDRGTCQMTNSRASLVGWLQDEFAEEQAAGFSRLKQVPDTRVIRFLDHFASLSQLEQLQIRAVLAEWSSFNLSGTPIPTSTYEQFARATAFPDRTEGIRYTGVNLLAGLAKDGGLANWFQTRGISGRALQPPENLLPDLGDLVPVKIPTLRRMVMRHVRPPFCCEDERHRERDVVLRGNTQNGVAKGAGSLFRKNGASSTAIPG